MLESLTGPFPSSESNQMEVSQNAADSASPLSCSPECPQEEYVYEYQYAGSAGENIQHYQLLRHNC